MDYNSQKPLRPTPPAAQLWSRAHSLLRHQGGDHRYKTHQGYKSMASAEAAALSLSSSLAADSAPVPETAGTAAAAARMGPGARLSKAALATKLLSLSGVFAVHKPKGPTSAELLNRLKEKLLAGTAARVGARRRAGASESTLASGAFKAPEMKGEERENGRCVRSGQTSGGISGLHSSSCSLVGSCLSQGNKTQQSPRGHQYTPALGRAHPFAVI